jgi:sugar phosphate isomerase/epimerase
VSDDDYIVSYSLATLKKALDFCNDCAIPAMIFHSGLNPYILNYSIPKLYPTFKTALAQLVAYAITKKISLLIENTYELECLDFISRVLADFPEISLAFDLGHAACFSDLAIQKWFTALQPRMKHIHLHDNNLTQDQHLNLGEGVIPFASFQKNMIQVGSLTMETSLENIQDNFTYLTSHILTGGTKP